MPPKKGRPKKKKSEDKQSEDNLVVPEETEQKPVRQKRKRPAQNKPKSDLDDFTYGPTIDSKAVSVVSTVKRRKASNKVTTESKIFSQKEKKAFYECLKENGISCLNDEPLLERIFPNRSMAEIKAMIDGFSRKAQELNRKTEECVSGLEADPNASKQPIEKWFDLIHQMIPNPSKKDDISAVLIDIFDEYRNDCSSGESSQSEEEVLKPNYRAVYDGITAALNGKYAKQMDPINALVIVKLIEELKQVIKNDLNKKELSFLKSGFWWQIPNKTNAQKTSGEMVRAIHSQRQQQNDNESTEGNVINGEVQSQTQSQQSSDNSAEDQRDLAEQTMASADDINYETLKTYPKLRKIIECLNPLRVPIELMAEEFKLW